MASVPFNGKPNRGGGDYPRKQWNKPSGKKEDPPPEQGKILAVMPREGWNGGQATEVHLTFNQMESGGVYGRCQEWKVDEQGRPWPIPKGGITIRRAEMPVWLEYLTLLKGEFDAHPPTKKPKGKP